MSDVAPDRAEQLALYTYDELVESLGDKWRLVRQELDLSHSPHIFGLDRSGYSPTRVYRRYSCVCGTRITWELK